MAIERYFIEQGDMADTTDLADVVLSGAVQNEVLVRDGSSQWVNQLLDTASMEDAAVTLAKIANAAANDKLLGSGDSGSGSPYVEITLGSGLTMTGTTLSATGGGGAVDAVTEDINQSSHGFSVGDLLDHNGTIFILADSDDEATSDVQGVVSVNTDSNNFEITYSGKITLSGLTGGLQYYLSGTAGAATSTEPTEGNIVAPVYYAISTTVAIVNVQRPIQVTDTGGFAEEIIRKTSDTIVSTTAFIDITDLSFSVVANGEYLWEAFMPYEAAFSGEGFGFGVNGPTSPTRVSGHAIADTGTGTQQAQSFDGYDVDNIHAANRQAGGCFMEASGVFQNGSTAGTFQLRIRSESTSDITIRAGSILKVRRTN